MVLMVAWDHYEDPLVSYSLAPFGSESYPQCPRHHRLQKGPSRLRHQYYFEQWGPGDQLRRPQLLGLRHEGGEEGGGASGLKQGWGLAVVELVAEGWELGWGGCLDYQTVPPRRCS